MADQQPLTQDVETTQSTDASPQLTKQQLKKLRRKEEKNKQENGKDAIESATDGKTNDQDEENAPVEAEEDRKGPKKPKKPKKKGPKVKKQTTPEPTIPISKLFPDGKYPEGEVMDHPLNL